MPASATLVTRSNRHLDILLNLDSKFPDVLGITVSTCVIDTNVLLNRPPAKVIER